MNRLRPFLLASERGLFFFFLWSSACQSQPAAFSGQIEGFVRDSVYLFRWEAGQWERAAAAPIQEGKFAFSRKAVAPGLYWWGLSPQEGDQVWISESETPEVRGQAQQLFQAYTYEKSPTNADLLRLRRQIIVAYQRMGQLPPEQRAPYQNQIDSLLRWAEKHPVPLLRLYALLFRSPAPVTQGYPPLQVWDTLLEAFWKGFAWESPFAAQIPETFFRFQAFWQNAISLLPEDSLLSYADRWLKDKKPAIKAVAWMALLDVAQRFQRPDGMLVAAEKFLACAPQDPRRPQIEQFLQVEGALRKGQPAPDIALSDPQGQVRKLSDLRGQWVLIDFWASWCRPCRIENPHVVRLYQQYHSRGFEIFGVSLDHQREAWVKAIESDGLRWIHVSDLKGWQSAAAQLYRVSGIPFSVLVDPQGRIAAKGLRGPALEAKLKEIFP